MFSEKKLFIFLSFFFSNTFLPYLGRFFFIFSLTIFLKIVQAIEVRWFFIMENSLSVSLVN